MFLSHRLDPLHRARVALPPPPLRGRAAPGGTPAGAPTTASSASGGHPAHSVLWETRGWAASGWPSDHGRSSLARDPSGLGKPLAQSAPALGPWGSRHRGGGLGPAPRGRSHRWHRCLIPPRGPAPRGRRTGCGARPRVSLLQNLRVVCMVCLLLLRAVARLRSPALPPQRYKFHATTSPRGTARLRAPCGAQGP